MTRAPSLDDHQRTDEARRGLARRRRRPDAAAARWSRRRATRITAPSPISAVLSATATSAAGASLPRCAASIADRSPASASPSEPIGEPGLQRRSVGQFRHEGAIDENQPARFDVAEHRAGDLRPRFGCGIRRAAPAAWPRASARAGRCISSPRRGGAAGLPGRTRRKRPRAARQSPRRRAAARAPARKCLPPAPCFRRRLDDFDFSHGIHSASASAHATPPLPDIRRSRALRVRAPVPCRRS